MGELAKWDIEYERIQIRPMTMPIFFKMFVPVLCIFPLLQKLKFKLAYERARIGEYILKGPHFSVSVGVYPSDVAL